MKRRGIYGLVVALSMAAAPVLAQDAPTGQSLGDSAEGQGGEQDDNLPTGTQPSTTAPTDVPQIPASIPPPQQVQQPAAAAPADPNSSGQWVYTTQYGWVWAPYAPAYTYVAPDTNIAQMYVFRVGIGWGWVLSPWVYGIGPVPYWGAYGYRSYAWYSRPWFHAWYGPRPSYAWGHHYGAPYPGWGGHYGGHAGYYGGYGRGGYGYGPYGHGGYSHGGHGAWGHGGYGHGGGHAGGMHFGGRHH